MGRMTIPKPRERGMYRSLLADICSPGTETPGTIIWWKYLNGNFGKLLEAEYGLTWNWEIPGAAITERTPHFCGLFLQEPHQILTLRIWEISPGDPGRRRGKISTRKASQNALYHKDLLSRWQDCQRAKLQYYSRLGKGISGFSTYREIKTTIFHMGWDFEEINWNCWSKGKK